ncbi:MAG: BamA/TamA family outer membrane protein [Ginsengibacter sp.]
MSKKIATHILVFLCTTFIFISCNLTKHVPKDDALYTGATIKIEDSTISKKEQKRVKEKTEDLPRPKPNAKFLGIPFKLVLYNLGGDPEKGGFIRKFFRKAGEPPVLLSSVRLNYNVDVLRNFQENIGYFNARASGDTIVKKRKGHAYYTLTPGHAYTINEVMFDVDSSSLGKAIINTKQNSILKPKDHFNLEVIKGERSRIDAKLKEEGYYYFSPELLIVDVDSTIGKNQVNMYLKVKESTSPLAKKPYIIDEVYIYPNYRLNSDRQDTSKVKSTLYKGYHIVDLQNKFRPSLFPRILRFDSGSVYNRTDHNLSLSRLINLDVFKFVKNRFEDTGANEKDTGRLNTFYYLTPQPKKSIKAEIGGNTKSNDYVGSLFKITFRNRNTFRGAEHLDIYSYAGSEVQYGGQQQGFNTYRLGGGVKFSIPHFVVPFFQFNTTNAFVPRTVIDLSYDLLNRRKLYTLNSFKAELGYSWKPGLTVQQEVNPISLNYVRAINITQKYRDSILTDPLLKHAVDTQFILGSNYNFTLNPLANNPQGSGLFFNGLVDVSGNTIGSLINKDSDGKKRILGGAFAQYLKAQLDFRYYFALNKKLRWANRIITGFGYPYGNSEQLPFIKQYFIGGTNSVRAFRSRTLGPGTFRSDKADQASFLPDQSGDIKLELNTEMRIKFNRILEGAVFVDGGNIWLYNNDPLRPGTQFSNNFLKELAVGTGLGLRLDLTILLLRIDFAMPVRKPWLDEGNRWVLDQIDFSSKDWRRKNIIFNLAIGYPF